MYDIKKEFTFYASYHHDRINVIIHLLCIWPILATAILMLQYTPAIVSTPDLLTSIERFKDVKVNFAFLITLIYVACYVYMEPVVGGCAAFLVLQIFLLSGELVSTDATVLGAPVWKVALAIHVAAWILQFIGHGVFEGRAPALLDSLDQAFLTAPLFVFMEVFFFFGYRPKMQEEVMTQVRANIENFKKSKKIE